MSNPFHTERLAKQMARAQFRHDHLEPPAVTTETDMTLERTGITIRNDRDLLTEAAFEADYETMRRLIEAAFFTYGPERDRLIRLAGDDIASAYAPSLLDARATP